MGHYFLDIQYCYNKICCIFLFNNNDLPVLHIVWNYQDHTVLELVKWKEDKSIGWSHYLSHSSTLFGNNDLPVLHIV